MLAASLAGLAIRQPRPRNYHSGAPALEDTVLGNISHKMATPAARTQGTLLMVNRSELDKGRGLFPSWRVPPPAVVENILHVCREI
jgi:hypothetical protein